MSVRRFLIAIFCCCCCLWPATIAQANNPQLSILPNGPKVDMPTGSPLLLTCLGKGHEPTFFTDLKWINPRGEVIDDLHNEEHRLNYRLMKHTKDNSLMLSFLNPTESLSGRYTCNGFFQNVDQLSDTIDVHFFQDITWEDCPSTQALIKGQRDATIRCRVAAKPAADVNWKKDRREPDSHRFIRTYAGMSINGPVDNDVQGIYIVEAAVREVGRLKTIDITVEVHVQPEITHLSTEFDVVEEEEARLSCHATGVPSPNYYWLNNARQNLSSLGGYVVDTANGDLLIGRVLKPQDSGEFTCVASNAAGQAERHTRLKIISRPKIQSFTNVSYVKGSPATMLCEATGNPAPALAIRKDGHLSALASTGRLSIVESTADENSRLKLTINNLQREDDGLYYCLASSKAGEVNTVGHLQVEYPPDLTRTPKLVLSWAQRPVNISCIADAIPNATVSWYFRGSPVYEDAYYSIISASAIGEELSSFSTGGLVGGPNTVVGVNNLLIRPSSARPLRNFLGQYTCQAVNRHGTERVTIQLDEARVPDTPSAPNLDDDSPTTIRVRFTYTTFDGKLPIKRMYVRFREQFEPLHAARTKIWASDETYLLDQLRPRALYILNFAAENEVGLSAWSDDYRKQMPQERAPDPPLLPADLSDLNRPIQSMYADRFDVRWSSSNDNGRPIEAYIIRYYPSIRKADNWHRIGDIREHAVSAHEAQQFHLVDLLANTTYKAELLAQNSEGYSIPAIFTFRTGRRMSGSLPYSFRPFGIFHADLKGILVIGGICLLVSLILLDIILYTRYDYGACFYLLHRTNRSDDLHEHKTKSADTGNTGYSYHSPNDEGYPMMIPTSARDELRAELEHRFRIPKHSAV